MKVKFDTKSEVKSVQSRDISHAEHKEGDELTKIVLKNGESFMTTESFKNASNKFGKAKELDVVGDLFEN